MKANAATPVGHAFFLRPILTLCHVFMHFSGWQADLLIDRNTGIRASFLPGGCDLGDSTRFKRESISPRKGVKVSAVVSGRQL